MTFAQPRMCPIIVGRDRELAFGAQLLRETAAKHNRLLLISGEAGVGKSRLLREITAYATHDGFRLLAGVCQEHDHDYPFAPFLDALRQYMHGLSSSDVAALAGPDQAIFARLLPELGLAEQENTPFLPPEQEKRCIFEAFVGLFTRLTRGAPLLLALEDLHWADETSLELLQLLPRRLVAAPLLIAATARTDEPTHRLTHWLAYVTRNRLVAQLALSPLDGTETACMIEATLGTPVPVAVIDAVHRRAEGNPFLTEELPTHWQGTSARSPTRAYGRL